MKGLRGNQTETERQKSLQRKQSRNPSQNHNSRAEQFTIHKGVFNENELLQVESEKALALADEATNSSDMEILDQEVKSMMTFSEKANLQGSARICNVCGQEGGIWDIMNHIEAHHIAGISIPCGLCGKVFTTRCAQTQHKSKYHRK